MEEKIEKELNENKAPVEETKKAKELVQINKPDGDKESFEIERERSTLYADYKKSRKISNIITCVVLVVGLAGVILITQQSLPLTITGWSLMGATVLGLVAYYIVNKNKFPNKTREYIKTITKLINEHTFRADEFTDVVTDPQEKFDISELIADGVYQDVAIAQSRNVVRGKYAGKDFLYAEVALFKQQATRNKKEGPMFVGKYISYPNNLEMKGRIVINLKKSDTPLDVPTGVGDLTVLKEQPNLGVYGLKETDVEKVLGKKFYAGLLEDLAIKEHLINVNVVVWAGKSAIYFSYDDAAMGLPFDKEFDRKPYDQMADNLSDAFALLNKIGK